MTHRRDIQGLRAVAVLLVVLAHAGVPGFAGGFVGVDVFFVLSGYLITGLLLRERAATGAIGLAAFYARRLKRLLPALLVMLVGALALGAVLLTPAELHARAASAGFAATWTSNLYFAFADLDYFAELEQRDLFLHTWSLGVEEQFYLAWPLLVLALVRGGPVDAAARRRLVARLAAVLVVGVAGYGAGLLLDPARTFYLMPARIWQFALGALVGVAVGHGAGAPQRWADWAGGSGLALVVGSAFMLDPVHAGGWIAVPSVGAALLIAAGCGQAAISRGLSHPVPVWIGDRSYSWYLWHWPVLILGSSVGVTGAPVAALVLASLALASLSYGLVERPLWKGGWAATLQPRLVNLAAVLAMALFVAVAVRDPPPQPPVARAIADEREGQAFCDDWIRSAAVRPCAFGPADAKRTAVLIGDSIGAQWLAMVRGALPGWRTVLLTKSACPIVDEDFVYERIGRTYDVCREWREAVLAYVDAQRPDLVVFGSSVQYPFSREQWVGGTSRVLRRLTAAARHTVVIPGTPGLSFHGPQCLEQNRRVAAGAAGLVRSCGEPWKDGSASAVAGWLGEAVRPFPQASLLDLNERICPSRWCRADTPAGQVVFRDSRHLTADFAGALAPVLADHLAAFAGTPAD